MGKKSFSVLYAKFIIQIDRFPKFSKILNRIYFICCENLKLKTEKRQTKIGRRFSINNYVLLQSKTERGVKFKLGRT